MTQIYRANMKQNIGSGLLRRTCLIQVDDNHQKDQVKITNNKIIKIINNNKAPMTRLLRVDRPNRYARIAPGNCP